MTSSGPSTVLDEAGIPPSRLSLRDLVVESVSALLARPSRSALTAFGTVLGVAALVATLGIAKTAGNQIVTRFDALAATEVVASAAQAGSGFGAPAAASTIPWDAQDRLERLNGVVAAGTWSEVDTGGAMARSVPFTDPLGSYEFTLPVVASSPGLLDAVRGSLVTGRYFDGGHDERADRVAVLGPGAARRLGIDRVDNLPAVFVGERAFAVVGIIADVERQPSLLNAVIIPDGTAREIYGLTAPAEVHVDTEVGAARLISGQAPIALDPNEPDRIRIDSAPDPIRVRSEVEGDVNAMFIVLGAVALLVGALGIANVTLVSVMERIGEIGLRRAVGASRRHIAGQFLAESTVLGLIGGILGTSAGLLIVVAVSAQRSWTPVLDPWLPFVAPVAGAVVGLVAGVYPATRAARTEPVDALRQGT